VPRRSETTLTPEVLYVMPPGKHFGPLRATSIDLDTRDFVRFSQYRETTRVVVDKVDPLFERVNTIFYPDRSVTADATAASHVGKVASEVDADVIVVQQRLPLAARIARAAPQARIVLHTHNFQKNFADRPAVERLIRMPYRRYLYRQLDGIIHVSETCEKDYLQHWGDIGVPSAVIGNGLDFCEWEPRAARAQEVLCVARFAPEKGVLEAALAAAQVLPEFPDWTMRFILSEVDRHPRYWAEFHAAASQFHDQVRIEKDQPFDQVKAAYEQVAIALVPSKWVEPFGRTALEAHAGGAALISSGSGGLSEISGETALMLSEVSSGSIARALRLLMTNAQRRGELAKAGAERVRIHFDIRQQAAALDQFIEHIAYVEK